MKRKVYFVVPFLILVLVFSFSFISCSNPKIIEQEDENSNLEKKIDNLEINEPEIVLIAYLVVGINTDEVSVTYSNHEGGTEQKVGLKLKDSLEDIFQDPNLHVYDTSHYDKNKEKYRAELVYHYWELPEDGFFYLSAQNQKSCGAVYVEIIVNDIVWKSSKSEGEYCIATVSGYYNM